MARNRFDWSTLPNELLAQLGEDLSLGEPDVAAALARRYGPRPSETFVHEAWPALRERWVSKDPTLRRSVVTALRARGVGTLEIRGASARADIAYLRSCRNSAGLRRIVLAHLLALGHPAAPEEARAVRGGATTSGAHPLGETTSGAHPGGAGELAARVKEVVRALLGVDEVVVDADGDIFIRSQASVTYVRVFKEAPIVRVLSPVLWDFGDPNDIEETVNEINRRTNWVKAVWEDGAVLLFSDVVGDPLAESQLVAAINSVVARADELGPHLQQRYGGRLAVGAPKPPRTSAPIGGYL